MTAFSRTRTRRKPLYGLAALIAAVSTLSACAGPAPHRSGSTALGAPALAAADRAVPNAPCGKPPVQLEPQDQAFLNRLAAAGGPPLYGMTYAAARKSLDQLQAGPVSKLPADISERTVPGGPTGPVSIRVVRPAGVKGPLPGIVYIHGGGWVLGNAQTHDRLVRQIANGARAAVVFVNYTPSPEAQYPVPLEQSYTAAKWVAEHGKEINVDSSRLAIAGDSAGGDMAAAVTLLAKERGGPHFLHQVLLYPVVDADFGTASGKRFAEGCWLTAPAMKWFWDAYAPKLADRGKPTASPLRATTDQLRGLPPALVITDSDALLDAANAYAAKLRAAGVPVTSTHYANTIHDFMMLNALADTQAAKAAVAEASETLHGSLYAPAPVSTPYPAVKQALIAEPAAAMDAEQAASVTGQNK